MCRFQCSDPKTCKVSKYALGSIKRNLLATTTTTNSLNQPFYQSFSPPKFVRNNNVKFFSGASDSDYSSSDDELTYFPQEEERQKQRTSPVNVPEFISTDTTLLPKTTTLTSNDSSVDSGFIEGDASKKSSTENLKEESKEIEKPQLKSILLKKNFFVEERPKKCVRFADDCGKFLVRVRNIPARDKIDAIWNDVVDLSTFSSENENDSNGWREALLYKLLVTAGFR
ncbi:hypothetical protein Mgra_00002509 [Meloidogyne graminicola]|uniref:Uncharacterized protein n=1 Tax=Meloidogyne graminicola TaxID=189291 RepID=A0A8S9ZYG5_9BILA|nr:hypothetical protein Mgra_00002509 [Meloidogyne graminicola]